MFASIAKFIILHVIQFDDDIFDIIKWKWINIFYDVKMNFF